MSFRKIKLSLAKKYLDWAEDLPRFQGGLLRSLQRIREHQRKWSEDCYNDTRPPEGASIEFKELVLIDVFELEDFDRLSSGLKKLFPNLKSSKDSLGKMEWNSGSLHSAGWHRIGMVAKSRTIMPIGERTIDPTLPSYIDYVSVEIYGITPSVTAIALTFGMADEISAQLKTLHDCYYLPEVEFKKMFPWGRMVGGYSENAVEAVMQRNVLKRLMCIRDECEKWALKYFRSSLLNDAKRNRSSMGAIEIFAINGVPDVEDKKLSWKNRARNWLHPFGITIDGSTNFVRENFTFCWSSTGREQQAIPVRILVSNDDVDHHLEFIAQSLVAPIAIISYLNHIKKSVELMRVDIFQATKIITQNINTKNIANNLILKRSVMILNRMRVELNHGKSWFFHLMESVNDFKSTPEYYGDKGLDRVLYEHISCEIDHIQEHGKIAETNITEYIGVQNILVMFILQRRMLVLTIVAALATIISTLVSYEKIIELWNMVVSKI